MKRIDTIIKKVLNEITKPYNINTNDLNSWAENLSESYYILEDLVNDVPLVNFKNFSTEIYEENENIYDQAEHLKSCVEKLYEMVGRLVSKNDSYDNMYQRLIQDDDGTLYNMVSESKLNRIIKQVLSESQIEPNGQYNMTDELFNGSINEKMVKSFQNYMEELEIFYEKVNELYDYIYHGTNAPDIPWFTSLANEIEEHYESLRNSVEKNLKKGQEILSKIA